MAVSYRSAAVIGSLHVLSASFTCCRPLDRGSSRNVGHFAFPFVDVTAFEPHPPGIYLSNLQHAQTPRLKFHLNRTYNVATMHLQH